MTKQTATISSNIINDLKAGISTCNIASKYSISQTTVTKIAQDIKADIPSPKIGCHSQVSNTTR
jgi:DNA invertase Pin-like site-specific DNA recombinase